VGKEKYKSINYLVVSENKTGFKRKGINGKKGTI
jgi:hypothetical protein